MERRLAIRKALKATPALNRRLRWRPGSQPARPDGDAFGPQRQRHKAIFRGVRRKIPASSGSGTDVAFLFENYIDINPENHGRTFRQKLNMAAKMVRISWE
jgi:hypothetical protein